MTPTTVAMHHDTKATVLHAVLRIALGTVFIIGGIKLAFLGDTAALAASYLDPAKGWIAPVFADKITQLLGLNVGVFLRTQGWLEMLLGVLFILGIGTRPVALLMGLMFWSFAVANPVAGEIRLSRDITLAALCMVIALAGAGAWSLDRRLWNKPYTLPSYRHGVLCTIRLSLAYTLLASAVFADGVFANPLNTTLPILLVLLLGLVLLIGVYSPWVMALIGLWMVFILGEQILAKGIYFGLDAAKRELGFLAAALFYTFLGPDRWAWPRPQPDAADADASRCCP